MLKGKGKLVVGLDRDLRADLLAHFHGDGVSGHLGMQATYRRLSSVFYWKGLEKDVTNHVRECAICQRFKPELVAYSGLLQTLSVPDHI